MLLIGGLEVRTAERRVLLHGEPVALGGRAFDLLVALIERGDRVVSKDELLALVWPGVVVEENNLTVQVSALRKALGADAIATVAGRGYRFTLPVPGLDDARSGGSTAAIAERHNLPAERSSFIGRVPQIAAVRELLDAHRLVTLTGMGGTGKTRLALRVAALEMPRFGDGVFFVDLAPFSDARFVVQKVAASCGLTVVDSPADSPDLAAKRLVSALASRRCLLVVDNCEHLLDACAALVDALLTQCAQLVVLATSREALALEGEQVLSVPPLALPLGDEVTDAIRLFEDRARAVNSAFVLDARSRKPVAEVCRRLDGIPLAIEFAAARTALLSPAEVAQRLDDRLHLLGGGNRRVDRQQTLAATMDWSHDLLDKREQALFRRLAVFANGFTMRALEAVYGAEAASRVELLDLMASLVAKSLVTVTIDAAGDTRYRLLETVRLYAQGKLAAAGETDRWRTRHRDAWLAWLEAAPLESLTLEVDTIAAVGREINDLRAAAATCLAEDRPDLLARLASRLIGFHLTGNRSRDAFQLLEQALERPDRLTLGDRVACHTALCVLHLMANDLVTGLDHAEHGVDLGGERIGEFEVTALIFRGFARSIEASVAGADSRLRQAARLDAGRAVERAAALSAGWRAFCEIWAADVELILGDHEAGAKWAQAAERDCREIAGPTWVLGSALTKLAVSFHLLGRAEPAVAAASRGLEQFDAQDARQAMADGWRVELAAVFYAGGRQAVAQKLLREGAVSMRRSGVDEAPNQFLIVAAVVEFLRGELRRSAQLLGAARSVGGADKDVMAFRTPTSMGMYQHYLPLVRAALGADEARRLRDQGRGMVLDEAFAFALKGIA